MVKKICLTLIIVLSIIVVIAGYNIFVQEDKQFSALKTEAVYSSFGYPGFVEDGINVIEADKNGRLLYEFYGQNFANHYGIVHILVCQYIDYEKKLVYYYPGNNFIIRRINEETSYEQLEQLKIFNDWDKEINLSGCVSKKIGEYKDINDDIKIANIFDNLNVDIEEQYKKIVLCDTDKNGLKLYAVKIAKDEQTYKIFALIVKNDDYTNYDIVEIENWYYIDEINDFKIKHDWLY